jgi:hypothetical protein
MTSLLSQDCGLALPAVIVALLAHPSTQACEGGPFEGKTIRLNPFLSTKENFR